MRISRTNRRALKPKIFRLWQRHLETESPSRHKGGAVRPERRVFIGHPKTAGLGLNELVAANYVIHFDHWLNPAVANQATARAHRPGQQKTVFAYHLWVQGTYEEIIFNLLLGKQSLYDRVVDSMSEGKDVSDDIFLAVTDSLFAKYGLKPATRRKDAAADPS